MKKRLMDLGYSLIVITIISLIASCSDLVEDIVGDDNETIRISGMVIDENGIGVANVKVYTTPPTATAFTDSSGSYTIEGTAFGESARKSYTVHAERAGYQSSTTTIVIDAESDNIANLTIHRSVNGLVAQDMNGAPVETLTIGKNENSTTFVLTSTTPNNTFSFSSDKPWLTITPASGKIDDLTKKIIEVKADKSGLSDGLHTATIIGNGNTEDGVQLTVTVAKNVAPPKNVTPSTCTDNCGNGSMAIKTRGIKFDVPNCWLETNGTSTADVTCEFYVTRLTETAILEIGEGSEGTSVSVGGIVYSANGVYLGGQQASGDWVRQTLIKDVPMLAKAVFPGLPTDTWQLEAITFSLWEKPNSYFTVIFKDIPVSR